MFSCCQSSDRSDNRRAKRSGCGYRLRRWGRTLLRCIWPFSNRETKSKRGLYNPPAFNSCNPNFLKEIVEFIPTAIENEDYTYISLILAVYPKFLSTWKMLDLVLQTYPTFDPDCEEDQQKKSAIRKFLSMWLQDHPDDFLDYPDLETVKNFLQYLKIHIPSSEVNTAELLLVLEEQESKKGGVQLMSTSSEASMLGETPDLRTSSVAGPQGDEKPQEDTEVMDPGFIEQTLPEAGPVQLLTLDQPLPTAADSQTPQDGAGDAPTDGHTFLAAVVHLGAPEADFPLPDVDI